MTNQLHDKNCKKYWQQTLTLLKCKHTFPVLLNIPEEKI